MSSTHAVLLGSQVPRIGHAPKHFWSHADDAAFLASGYGLTPDEWQHLVLEAWLGEDQRGKWTSGRCGLAVPRQNGKNGALEVRELYGMVALGEKFLHTAHEVKTARKAFVRLASFFENERKYPELAALVKEIRKTNGQEAIVLWNADRDGAGASIEFVARSRGSGRGYTVDVLVLDEAQELTDEQLEALLPTISAAPLGNPQTIFTGTPPGPTSPGEVFTRIRDAGVAGKDKRLSWHEWSLEGPVKNIDITDLSNAALTNPALGTRLHISVIQDELPPTMSADGFARERYGMWASDVGTSSLIPADVWRDLIVPESPSMGIRSYGVKFAVDGSAVALAVAIKPESGPVHVEVIGRESMSGGTDWLVKALVKVWREAAVIVIDGKAGVGPLVNALHAAGVQSRVIVTPSADQVISAHAFILEAIETEALSHFDQAGLNDSISCADKRDIGKLGGWGWKSIRPDGEVLRLDAVTLAHYGAMTSKRKQGRSGEGRRGVVL